jgi:hypothetical protein
MNLRTVSITWRSASLAVSRLFTLCHSFTIARLFDSIRNKLSVVSIEICMRTMTHLQINDERFRIMLGSTR